MNEDHLSLRELLIDDAPGRLSLLGARTLLIDAVAMGLLRKLLVEALGLGGARAILTQTGWAHGRRSAEALRDAVPWSSPEAWQQAGARLHELQGIVRVEVPAWDPARGPEPFAHGVWRGSYEAEQHLLHLGEADAPVCWTLTGFAGGWLSFVHGRPFYCRETRCVAMGDDACEVVGRARDEWPEEERAALDGVHRCGALDARLDEVARSVRDLEARLERQRALLGADPVAVDPDTGLVARSEGMRRVLDVARRVAPVDTTVLITGESGVGKERIARLVHDRSARRRGPFVAVNCGALEETLLGSELFGHARGAFTGATADRPGLFEAASGGTLFLDEVGEVTPAVQVRLLRVLQEREVRRLGEQKARPVDVRVVAATNRDLAADVKSGRFREDLLYRLRVVEVRVPPLRDRPEDILDLARHALARAAERTGRELCGFTPRAIDALLRHPWPGNVRELENAVEHAVVLAPGSRVDADDLPAQLARPPAPMAPGAAAPERAPAMTAGATETPAATPGAAPAGPGPSTAGGEGIVALEDVERAHVLATLARLEGHREKAAEALGIAPATIYRKLKRWGITAE